MSQSIAPLTLARASLAVPGVAEYVLGQMPPERPARFTLRDMLIAVFYHKRAIVLAFLIPLAVACVAAGLSKLVFIADARLLVLLGNQYVLQPDTDHGGSVLAFDRNQIIQSELEILQSETLRLDVLRRVGVDHVYPPTQAGWSLGDLVTRLTGEGTEADRTTIGGKDTLAAARMRNDLSVSSAPQSNVIALSFRHPDRMISAEVLNAVIATYVERRGEIFRRSHSDASSDGSDQYAARLRDAETELARFAEDTRISSFDEQVTILLRDQADLTKTLHDTEQRLSSVAAQVDTVRRQTGKLPATVEIYAETQRSQVSSGLTDQLLRLEAQRRDLMSRYRPEFPPLVDLEHQIAELRAQMGRGGAVGPAASDPYITRRGQNPAYVDANSTLGKLEVERDGLTAQRTNLLAAQQQVQGRLDQLNQIGSRYRELKRTRDVLEETYRTFVRGAEQARMSDAVDRGQLANIRIIQAAEPPPYGTRPRKVLVLAGLALGLAAAAVAFWMAAAMRQVMIGVSDAERALGLPVLLAISHRGAPSGVTGQRSYRLASGQSEAGA